MNNFKGIKNIEELTKEAVVGERRYRATIYVDIWVNDSGNETSDYERALQKANDLSDEIPNSYVGEVFDPTKII